MDIDDIWSDDEYEELEKHDRLSSILSRSFVSVDDKHAVDDLIQIECKIQKLQNKIDKLKRKADKRKQELTTSQRIDYDIRTAKPIDTGALKRSIVGEHK